MEQKQLDPKELDIRIRTIVEQRNNALDTISVLNGNLFMLQEEVRRLSDIVKSYESAKEKPAEKERSYEAFNDVKH